MKSRLNFRRFIQGNRRHKREVKFQTKKIPSGKITASTYPKVFYTPLDITSP